MLDYIITQHIAFLELRQTEKILEAVYFLLNRKFNFINQNKLNEEDFQNILYSLNEKQSTRKSNGIFNTPNDIIKFILTNAIDFLDDKDKFIDLSVFDPTVGSGEFLINILKAKLKQKASLDMLATIHGNDIDIYAVEICKVRLFFEMIKWNNSYIEIAKILNDNITNYDFINLPKKLYEKRYDLIIGNPPYIEDSKSKISANTRYGNIYANVLQNSVDLLAKNGIMGFIIPISYVSTPRMSKIRKYIEQNTSEQKIFNYADRPSCLFSGVHQKLTILLAQKGTDTHKVYTSSYNYWYKEEREKLFNCKNVVLNNFINDNFYPKIGNKTEHSIYGKINNISVDNLLSLANADKNNIFLNMRACFWIKAFSKPKDSKEFKGFAYNESHKWAILAILNSTLFWWHWILISDCWHITKKELLEFKIPKTTLQSYELAKLAKQLEHELEKTKEEINTKQAKFEYKHKLCRLTIDMIDDHLAKCYQLTEFELLYIKNFAKKYREGLGV